MMRLRMRVYFITAMFSDDSCFQGVSMFQIQFILYQYYCKGATKKAATHIRTKITQGSSRKCHHSTDGGHVRPLCHLPKITIGLITHTHLQAHFDMLRLAETKANISD